MSFILMNYWDCREAGLYSCSCRGNHKAWAYTCTSRFILSFYVLLLYNISSMTEQALNKIEFWNILQYRQLYVYSVFCCCDKTEKYSTRLKKNTFRTIVSVQKTNSSCNWHWITSTIIIVWKLWLVFFNINKLYNVIDIKCKNNQYIFFGFYNLFVNIIRKVVLIFWFKYYSV